MADSREPGVFSGHEIFRIWLPLAVTWLAMAGEVPLLTGFIARMPDPAHNLAAWGVAAALDLLCESPIFGMISAVIALTRNRRTYLSLRRFAFIHCFLTSALVVVLARTPLFTLITKDLMGLDEGLGALISDGLLLMAPVPAAVGYRRMYQGILVLANKSRFVALGTIGRLLMMFGSGMLLYQFTDARGIVVASLALDFAVIFEAIYARILARPDVERLMRDESTTAADSVSFIQIATFYYPFAASMVIALVIVPIVSLFMAKGASPLESLAVFPVVSGLTMLFRSPGLAYQEVVIALLGRSEKNLAGLMRFSRNLAIALSGLLAIAVLSPLASNWLVRVNGLDPALVAFTDTPLRILIISPALAIWICTLRGVFLFRKRTAAITLSGTIELCSITAAMWLGTIVLGAVGIDVCAAALIFGAVLSAFWLSRQQPQSAG